MINTFGGDGISIRPGSDNWTLEDAESLTPGWLWALSRAVEAVDKAILREVEVGNIDRSLDGYWVRVVGEFLAHLVRCECSSIAVLENKLITIRGILEIFRSPIKLDGSPCSTCVSVGTIKLFRGRSAERIWSRQSGDDDAFVCEM